MHATIRGLKGSFLVTCVLTLCGVGTLLAADSQQVDNEPSFREVGPQVGEQIPNLNLAPLTGAKLQLYRDFNRSKKYTLIVTVSLTSPQARRSTPDLVALANKLTERVNTIVVYVVEAHPIDAVCPYKNIVDVTEQNRKDEILRKQSQTLAERKSLAQEFQSRFSVPSEMILVDSMDDPAWKAFGRAPNIAFLIDRDGIVAARQDWFDARAMIKPIREAIAHLEKWELQIQEFEQVMRDCTAAIKPTGMEPREILDLSQLKNIDSMRQFVKKHPESVNWVLASEGFEGRGRFVETLLSEAISNDNLPAAKFLLEQGASVAGRGTLIEPALELVHCQDCEMSDLLLRYQAKDKDPSALKSILRTKLLAGDIQHARQLVQIGAEIDFFAAVGLGEIDRVNAALKADPSQAARPDGNSHLPLAYAAVNDRWDIAKLLIDNGAPVTQNLTTRTKPDIFFAIHPGGARMVELLLDSGSSPDAVSRPEVFMEDGWFKPLLHRAINVGDLDVLKAILRHKPKLTIRDNVSNMPLHEAAELGKADCLEELLRAGADIEAKTSGFSTPSGHGGERRAKQNTPLHLAAARGNPETIKALLDHGAQIDAQNADGLTPLMATLTPPRDYMGLGEHHRENFNMLIDAGAAINLRTIHGRSVLDLAEASLNSHDWIGRHGWSEADLREIVKLLLARGAKHGEADKK